MYDHLRGMRDDRDLTQQTIAAMLKIDQSTYSDYESGKLNIPIATLIKLALFFDTSVDYLIGLTNEVKPYPRSPKNT